MSPFFQRLPATLALLALSAVAAFAALPATAASPAQAVAPADSTWTALALPAGHAAGPIFALAVDPADSQVVLVGTSEGGIYRSSDGGANWKLVRNDAGHGILSLAFDPYQPGLALAGTRGAGAWRSTDGGQTWSEQPGLNNATTRAFSFTQTLLAAGTDKGVFLSHGSDGWVQAGLPQVSVGALAISITADPAHLLAGGDRDEPGVPLPLYLSADSGATWKLLDDQGRGSSMVSALAAGSVQRDVRPLLMGTNTGLYVSIDSGTTWNGPLSGGGTLPATDYTSAAFVKDHFDRFYVASDGGGSDQGGLWYSSDSGAHFSSLQAPLPAVTALAVSSGEQPTLYLATYRPADRGVFLWSYRDTGAAPTQPRGGVPAPAGSQTVAKAKPAAAGTGGWLLQLLEGPEAPYLLVGLAAGAGVFLTLLTYVRRGRARRT